VKKVFSGVSGDYGRGGQVMRALSLAAGETIEKNSQQLEGCSGKVSATLTGPG